MFYLTLIFTCLSCISVSCGRIKVDPMVPLTDTTYQINSDETTNINNIISSNVTPLNDLIINQKQKALTFLKNKFPLLSFTISNEIKTKHSGLYHLYLKQSIDNLPVFNGDMAIHVDKNGEIISYSESIFKNTKVKIAETEHDKFEIDENEAFNLFTQYISQFQASK